MQKKQTTFCHYDKTYILKVIEVGDIWSPTLKIIVLYVCVILIAVLSKDCPLCLILPLCTAVIFLLVLIL